MQLPSQTPLLILRHTQLIMNNKATEFAAPLFVQRCIEPNCGHIYELDKPIYVCAICGGLLDIVWSEPFTVEPEKLRSAWLQRKTCSDFNDHSGVWRFREILPFHSSVGVVSLQEGNTPLYE